MQRLVLDHQDAAKLRLLCLGAHSDDIEIGAGGSVLTLLQRYPGAHVHWIVFSGSDQRAAEAHASAAAFLATAGDATIEVHDHRDGFFPDSFAALKMLFEALKRRFDPHVILSHAPRDAHQDHRIISDLTWNTFRDHLILGYEIPKYDPDLGNPNVLMPLDAATAEAKVALLMRHFESQQSRRWFVPETFMGLMRVRGVQAGAPSGLAEGFYGAKIWL